MDSKLDSVLTKLAVVMKKISNRKTTSIMLVMESSILRSRWTLRLESLISLRYLHGQPHAVELQAGQRADDLIHRARWFPVHRPGSRHVRRLGSSPTPANSRDTIRQQFARGDRIPGDDDLSLLVHIDRQRGPLLVLGPRQFRQLEPFAN